MHEIDKIIFALSASTRMKLPSLVKVFYVFYSVLLITILILNILCLFQQSVNRHTFKLHYSEDLNNQQQLDTTDIISTPSKEDALITLKTTKETKKVCTPLDHIFFLKTHKCGSSTLQRVLVRRGLERNLTFVLPYTNDIYIGYPERLDIRHILRPNLQPGINVKEHWDIFALHSRYSSHAVSQIMPKETARITILRPPAEQFKSTYKYFSLGLMDPNFEANPKLNNFIHFINQPISVMLEEIKKTIENRTISRHGINQMSFDLGLEPSSFFDVAAIEKFISEIDNDFTLVLMSEHMSSSLVLLSERMCWTLEDVRFLTQNVRPADTEQLTPEQTDKLEQVNLADTMLYRHFSQIFESKVKEYGEARMKRDIERLESLNKDLLNECVDPRYPYRLASQIKHMYGSENVPYESLVYKLRRKAPQHCKLYQIKERNIVSYLKERQLENFKL